VDYPSPTIRYEAMKIAHRDGLITDAEFAMEGLRVIAASKRILDAEKRFHEADTSR
jgi:hypothetical protein